MSISSVTARSTAIYLFVIGLLLLFAGDNILRIISPDFPASALFLSQLIAAPWLALSAVNWQHRSQILGGIYSRPIVYANLLMFTITALGVLRPALAPGASPWLWVIVIPSAIFALVFGALMLRGPFDALSQRPH